MTTFRWVTVAGLTLTVTAMTQIPLQAQAPSPLEKQPWRLLSIDGAPALPTPPASLEFKGQRLAGTGGCNRLIGQFKTEGDQLTVDPQMASTMMACPEPQMKQEAALTQALSQAKRYQITLQGELVIYYGSGNQSLRFQPLPQAALKEIYVGPKLVDCVGVGPQKCWRVKESAAGPWRLQYFPVEGFSYVPGFYYRLQIREETVPNPPADAPSRRWILVKELAKSPRPFPELGAE